MKRFTVEVVGDNGITRHLTVAARDKAHAWQRATELARKMFADADARGVQNRLVVFNHKS